MKNNIPAVLAYLLGLFLGSISTFTLFFAFSEDSTKTQNVSVIEDNTMAKQSTAPAATSNSVAALTEKVDFNEILKKGEVSAGRGKILEFANPGDSAGPFIIARIIPNVDFSDDGDGKNLLTVYEGASKDGTRWRLPIGAIWEQKSAELHLSVGDEVYIRREADVTKERGKGKGKPMKDWTIVRTGKGQSVPAAPVPGSATAPTS